MIDKIIYFSRADIEKYVWRKLEKPLATEVIKYAAINIHNPELLPSAYPTWVAPILYLSFHDVKFHQVKSERVINFTDKDAHRVIYFINQLDESEHKWILLINSENGMHRSASIVRFLKAINPQLEVTGLRVVSTDWHNILMSHKLALAWNEVFRSVIKSRQTKSTYSKLTSSNSNDELKSNLEQTIRGEKDNTRL